jgi:hypothetical protein
MTYIQHVPPGFRDFEWILFAGDVAERSTERVVLKAEEDSSLWYLSPKDVEVLADHNAQPRIFLRRDGEVLHLERGNRSGIPKSADAQRRKHPNCPVNTMCENNIELCCETPHRILGACNGAWECEDC